MSTCSVFVAFVPLQAAKRGPEICCTRQVHAFRLIDPSLIYLILIKRFIFVHLCNYLKGLLLISCSAALNFITKGSFKVNIYFYTYAIFVKNVFV